MRLTCSIYRSLVGTYFALLVGPFAAALAGASGVVGQWVALAVVLGSDDRRVVVTHAGR